VSRRAELLTAAAWAAAGTAILVASWRMNRLDDRGISPWSAPGLTPGVVGALVIVLAGVLALQARHAATAADPMPAPEAGSLRRTLLALALCIGFAGIALGHGLPFVVEGAIFIFVFTTLFSLPVWRTERRVGRGLLQTLAIAVLASSFIAWLFESVFLVRLP
jgi:putative tricarboxylic transport membrane protein